MKTRIILFTITILTVALATGCGVNLNVTRGSGNVITETREVKDFSALMLAGAGDVMITQGETESLTIEAEDNVMQRIRTEVQNGKLVIDFDSTQSRVLPTRPIRFNLAVKDLNTIELTGAGNITLPSLKTDRFTMHLSGAGNLKLDRLETTQAAFTASGAGNFDVSGQVDKQVVKLTGFGNYNGGNLASQDSQVVISGAGNATVWAQSNLDARISGAGSISYYGNPHTSRSVSGAGNVRSLGTK